MEQVPSVLNLTFVGLITCILAQPAFAQPAPTNTMPTCSFEIAARQKEEDGQLSTYIHLFRLECSNGECTFATVTLNRCFSIDGETTFFPRVELSTTKSGLTVKDFDGRVEVVERSMILGDESIAKFIFKYQWNQDHTLQILTDFSGGWVKNSSILGRTTTATYEPLKGTSGGFAEVELDCTAMTVKGL